MGTRQQLRTKVFDIAKEQELSLSTLAAMMGIDKVWVWRVREGKTTINQGFIEAAKRAFPDLSIEEMFYYDESTEAAAIAS